jgi:hypothetical protein
VKFKPSTIALTCALLLSSAGIGSSKTTEWAWPTHFLHLPAGCVHLPKQTRPAVQIDRMPTSVEEFKTLRDRIATTPEGGAAAFVIALKMYFDNPQVGIQCVIMQCHLPTLSQGDGPNSYGGYTLGNSDHGTLKTQRERSPWVMNSYFPGATSENNYQMPTGAFQMNLSTNNYSGNANEGTLKVFIKSSGADSPRPVTMVRNDRGVWKATMWSSLVVGCRPPANQRAVDDL